MDQPRKIVVHCANLWRPISCTAYHLRREDTDWFDKPREGHPQSGHMLDKRQVGFHWASSFTTAMAVPCGVQLDPEHSLLLVNTCLVLRLQMRLITYAFPHARVTLKRDLKDSSVSGKALWYRTIWASPQYICGGTRPPHPWKKSCLDPPHICHHKNILHDWSTSHTMTYRAICHSYLIIF